MTAPFIILLAILLSVFVPEAQAQIASETYVCFGESYTENHYISLQPTFNGTPDAEFAPGLTLGYVITDYPNVNGLTVGCDQQFAGSRRTSFFLDYTRHFLRSPRIYGPSISAGIGFGKWEEKYAPEMRLGLGYALPLTMKAGVILTISDRLGVGKHLSNVKNNFGAGLAFTYRIAETYLMN